jgi:hypothetical protein
MARNPRLRLAHGVLSRVLAGAVALSFASAPLPAQAVAPDQEIERLYVEGQDKYAEGDFAGAADAWTRLLDRLPEAQANRATRENVLLNVVQAHLDGYARTRKADGSKDIELLRAGKQVLDDYFASFKKAYGDRAAVSTAVQEKADDLERLLADAEREAAAVPEPGPGPSDGGGGTGPQPAGDGGGGKPNVIVLESGNDGSGLIAGGAVAAGLGLGGFGVLGAGVVIANRAEEDFLAITCESPCNADQQAAAQSERDAAEKRGRTGNALTITGAIVGPVLLITGGVLIGLGIKRRKDAKAARDEQLRKTLGVVPAAGRGFTGLVVSGRF